ncbi:hypothetical protein [Microbacterium sp.]|uniref:hypothetical protein n=1 Tax=Microbacterium sp. TaxID=51671 RepID=UPI002E31DE2D|nr:hypothetical protein [Microbacterium sp.]HEX5729932.1 hypothetical protein [Microbacterium sp.]
MLDDELEARQAALQAEGRQMLACVGPLLNGVGEPITTGSFVSGLMVWRDLDVMVLGGSHFSPHDVIALLGRAVDLPGVNGFEYVDERGDRSPTGLRRDERYHVTLARDEWRIDLSIWLYDDHRNVTDWHHELRERLTGDQRRAILRIKDVWHRRPEYPDEISGAEIYTAVLEHALRTPEEFAAHLGGR